MQFLLTMLSLYPGSTERYLPFLPLLYNNTHTAEDPGSVPGSFVAVGEGNSQNVQEEDMILQKFSGILTSYPGSNEQYLPFLPLLYNNTHSREPRPRAGAFCVGGMRSSQNVQEEDMIPQKFLGIIIPYPGSKEQYLPFLPLFYNTHSKEPRPRPGLFV